MNKTIASLTVAIVAGGSSLSAQLPAVSNLSVTSDLTFATEYAFRGVEIADNSFQPSIEASMGDFYLGLFSNVPLEGQDQSEIHYYGGFTFALPDVDFVTFDVGAKVYHWPDAGLSRTHEGFIGAKFEDVGLEGVNAAVYYFYDLDRDAHVLEGKVGYSFQLDRNGRSSLDVSAFFGNQFGNIDQGQVTRTGDAMRVNENYHYYGASLEIPYQVSEFSALTAGAHYQTAEDADLRGSNLNDDNLYWTISYTAGF